jgi:hypothetical protein
MKNAYVVTWAKAGFRDECLPFNCGGRSRDSSKLGSGFRKIRPGPSFLDVRRIRSE